LTKLARAVAGWGVNSIVFQACMHEAVISASLTLNPGYNELVV